MTEDASTAEVVVELTRRLLRSIAEGDWKTYASCATRRSRRSSRSRAGNWSKGWTSTASISNRGGIRGGYNISFCAPHVRVLGDAAVVCYVRLLQMQDDAGKAVVHRFEETRVWQRQSSGWRHVHFHRSNCG